MHEELQDLKDLLSKVKEELPPTEEYKRKSPRQTHAHLEQYVASGYATVRDPKEWYGRTEALEKVAHYAGLLITQTEGGIPPDDDRVLHAAKALKIWKQRLAESRSDEEAAARDAAEADQEVERQAQAKERAKEIRDARMKSQSEA